jgi:hypothetical protein
MELMLSAVNQLDVHGLVKNIFFAGWRWRNCDVRRCRKLLKIGGPVTIADNPTN